MGNRGILRPSKKEKGIRIDQARQATVASRMSYVWGVLLHEQFEQREDGARGRKAKARKGDGAREVRARSLHAAVRGWEAIHV